MKLRIIYLGKIKELTERDEQSIEVEKGTSVQGLIDRLSLEYPRLAYESFQISVNRDLVEFSFILNEEADVALLPPFAGG